MTLALQFSVADRIVESVASRTAAKLAQQAAV